MVRYASPLLADPERVYRQVDIAGRTGEADPHALVQLLYTELGAALRAAAWAAQHNQFKTRADKVTRATAILFALEAGLDFDKGGAVSETLARLYAGARNTVVQASLGTNPTPFLDVASNLEEIASAWASVRG